MYFKWIVHLFALICAHFVKHASWFCKIYENVLPALGGKHIFEERFLPVSCARPCFHTQTGFKIATFRGAFPPCAVQKMIVFADWAENGPPGKLNFTSLLISHAFWSRFSKFRDWFCYNLWKTLPVLVAKHSTFGEAITAWHEACVGAISSWSRPAAIADFTLHALFRPSAAVCRS